MRPPLPAGDGVASACLRANESDRRIKVAIIQPYSSRKTRSSVSPDCAMPGENHTCQRRHASGLRARYTRFSNVLGKIRMFQHPDYVQSFDKDRLVFADDLRRELLKHIPSGVTDLEEVGESRIEITQRLLKNNRTGLGKEGYFGRFR